MLIILILVILCFRQGRLASCAKIWFILFSQRRLAFRANNFGLSSVLVGREVKCEVLVIWKVNNS